MNPLEILLKYPGFAQQIVPQMRPPMNGTNQQALDMAMQMSTPLMVGRVKSTRLLNPKQANDIFEIAKQFDSGAIKFDPAKAPFVRDQLKTVFDVAKIRMPEHVKQGKLTMELAIKSALELARKIVKKRYGLK